MSTAAYQIDSKWFGGGYIFGVQTVAPGGGAPSVLLPTQVATIQEANVDFALGTKELRGIFEDPEDVATASRKITGKVVTGRVNITQLNDLVFGEAAGNLVTGSADTYTNEPQTIPGGYGPYEVTVDNPEGFELDLGIMYAGTRIALEPVSGTPGQGQYSYDVETGTYTFSAADAGQNILICYRTTTDSGHSMIVHNLPMGSNVRPVFQALFQNPNEGDQELLLYACKATKVTVPIKIEDYVKLEIDFVAFANAQGQTFQWLTSF